MRKNPRQLNGLLQVSAFAVASALAGGALVGCRVSDSDVKRWGTTEHGPDKLVAVLSHDKYDWPLRIEAGLELLRMKPRAGRRIGINRLVESLAALAPDERKKAIEGMVPTLVAQMKEVPPAAVAGQPAPIDSSFAYKDAAIAILTYEKAVLVTDDSSRKQLTDALIDWSQHDFDHRLVNSAQMFGMEQMMRSIGAPAVKPLPALITVDSTNYDRIASPGGRAGRPADQRGGGDQAGRPRQVHRVATMGRQERGQGSKRPTRLLTSRPLRPRCSSSWRSTKTKR